MEEFFTPFTTTEGGKKYIHQLMYEDLKQLQVKDISEGVTVEYKREFSQSVQKKLPNIISSFSNERGGWIFIGIDESQKTINPIANTDYELIINNQLRDLVNPKPRVQIRFIPNPEDATTGVLVLYVLEGESPPYISSGKIYRRIGSGTNQLKEIEDRYHLDKLYEKSEKRKNRLIEFCNKDISVFNREWNTYRKEFDYMGMLSTYIIPTNDLNLLESTDIDELAQLILSESKKLKTYTLSDDGLSISMNMPFLSYSISHNSIIFRNTDTVDYFENTCALELFFDGSAKIHIPMAYRLDKDNIIDVLSENIENYENKKVFENYDYVDGASFLLNTFACFSEYISIIRKLIEDFNEAVIVNRLEYVRKDVLFFDFPEYINVIKNRGLIFSEKNEYTTNKTFLPTKFSDNQLIDCMINLVPVFNMFGFSSKEGLNLFSNSMAEKTNKKHKS